MQEIQDTMKRSNLRIIGIEESEDSQLRGLVNIFNKIIKEKFPNLKKEMPINIQETNRLDQKRNSSGGWGFSSVVERLPRKRKALGSVPSSEKKNQKKKKEFFSQIF